MKQLNYACLFFIFLAYGSLLCSQTDSIRLECQVSNCGEELFLYTFNGFNFEKTATAPAQGEGIFVFTLPATAPRFYYVGNRDDMTKPVIIGTEKEVSVRGNCRTLRTGQIAGSRINTRYLQLRGVLSKLTVASNKEIRELATAYRENNEEKIQTQVALLKDIDLEKTALLDSLRRENDDFLYTIAGLNLMLSYQNNQGEYSNEVEYFGNEFFRFVDFSNPGLQDNPMVFEAFRNYATTLSTVGLPDEVHLAFLRAQLDRTKQDISVYQMALGGVLNALERTTHANYAPLAQEFVDNYGEAKPELAALVRQKILRFKGVSIGGEAPDFSQITPEGVEMKLSDLRGKVVLIDFWASWCGPCRRENPNVVQMYHKFKDKGFEILGVSLDNDKDRWLQAIEADGLTWHHVSDLKGWSNEVAQIYGVRAIPHTFLVDAEGKVIARNLRGESLSRKLEELFSPAANGSGQ